MNELKYIRSEAARSKSYESYRTQYLERQLMLSQKGLYMDSPMMNPEQYEMRWTIEKNEMVKRGYARGYGNIGRNIVSEQAYNTTYKQSLSLSKAQKMYEQQQLDDIRNRTLTPEAKAAKIKEINESPLRPAEKKRQIEDIKENSYTPQEAAEKEKELKESHMSWDEIRTDREKAMQRVKVSERYKELKAEGKTPKEAGKIIGQETFGSP